MERLSTNAVALTNWIGLAGNVTNLTDRGTNSWTTNAWSASLIPAPTVPWVPSGAETDPVWGGASNPMRTEITGEITDAGITETNASRVTAAAMDLALVPLDGSRAWTAPHNAGGYGLTNVGFIRGAVTVYDPSPYIDMTNGRLYGSTDDLFIDWQNGLLTNLQEVTLGGVRRTTWPDTNGTWSVGQYPGAALNDGSRKWTADHNAGGLSLTNLATLKGATAGPELGFGAAAIIYGDWEVDAATYSFRHTTNTPSAGQVAKSNGDGTWYAAPDDAGGSANTFVNTNLAAGVVSTNAAGVVHIGTNDADTAASPNAGIYIGSTLVESVDTNGSPWMSVAMSTGGGSWIPSGTVGVFTVWFSNVVSDSWSLWNVASREATVNTSGWWRVTFCTSQGSARSAGAADTYKIETNGLEAARCSMVAGGTERQFASIVRRLRLSSGDTVRLRWTCPANEDIALSPLLTWLEIEYLGAR